MKKVVLLGSTGSVGRSLLDIIRRYPREFELTGMSANSSDSLFIEQINEFRPGRASISSDKLAAGIQSKVSSRTKIYSGPGAASEIASKSDADIVFIAISGTSALMPLVAAIKAGKKIALASKEPIVSAGKLIMEMAQRHGAQIIPVDSEHSAIQHCLEGCDIRDVEKLYITGSGGPLWVKEGCDMSDLTTERVLKHPKWSMGRKITVDSATFMNKGLEMIEARWLFGVEFEKIDVVIHPEAIVHSLVEFVDGTIKASLFNPDMRFPLLRALAHPGKLSSDLQRVDLIKLKKMSFYKPDKNCEKAIEISREALGQGGTMPAVMNGANESAVHFFLEEKIRFNDIMDIVCKVMQKHCPVREPGIDEIILAEKWAGEEVRSFC
ncbi:MAG: 1-deoxy-D-xylulose-5-phosphate reductoisomerase [Candidatus Omnitrophica bacterium]|nr:1-deoxy-D-xylulose-5-phosphate reductoisomerase [Candidatus Omnitrophota bacterium]